MLGRQINRGWSSVGGGGVVGGDSKVAEMMIAACLAMPSWPWPSNSITAQRKIFQWYQWDCNPISGGVGGGEILCFFNDSKQVWQNTAINLDYNKSKVVMVMMVMVVMVEVMGMILSLGIFGGGKKNRGNCWIYYSNERTFNNYLKMTLYTMIYSIYVTPIICWVDWVRRWFEWFDHH